MLPAPMPCCSLPPCCHTTTTTRRDPLHARADRSCWWELSLLATHAHPSVAAFARTLLAGSHIVYDGDPLKDHSLVAFLDKFILKKAKAKAAQRGQSLMQPLAQGGSVLAEALVGAKPGSAGAGGGGSGKKDSSRGVEVDSDAFAALAEADVAAEDVFFHRFYNLSGVKSKTAAVRAIADISLAGRYISEADMTWHTFLPSITYFLLHAAD